MQEIKLNYGNWVRKRILLVLGIATLAVGALELVRAGAEVQLTPLRDVLAVPAPLRHPRILGKVAILSGKK